MKKVLAALSISFFGFFSCSDATEVRKKYMEVDENPEGYSVQLLEEDHKIVIEEMSIQNKDSIPHLMLIDTEQRVMMSKEVDRKKQETKAIKFPEELKPD